MKFNVDFHKEKVSISPQNLVYIKLNLDHNIHEIKSNQILTGSSLRVPVFLYNSRMKRDIISCYMSNNNVSLFIGRQ